MKRCLNFFCHLLLIIFFTSCVKTNVERVFTYERDLLDTAGNALALIYAEDGNFYFTTDSKIYQYNPNTEKLKHLAGTDITGGTQDEGLGIEVNFNNPYGLEYRDKKLYIAGGSNHCIHELDLESGFIKKIAGQCTEHGFDGDQGPASEALLNTPYDLSFDSEGNLYVADQRNHRIRKIQSPIDERSIISTVVGSGLTGENGGAFTGDGDPSLINARLNRPFGITFSPGGELFIADFHNHRIRKVNFNADFITTIAGTGDFGNDIGGFSGEEGTTDEIQLSLPKDIFFKNENILYIVDSGNHRIRELDFDRNFIRTVAGSGETGLENGTYSGDGSLATEAHINFPSRITLDEENNLYIADQENMRIRKIDNGTQIISTLIGNGKTYNTGDKGFATAARFDSLGQIRLDPDRENLYITDPEAHVVRKINLESSLITRIAGTGTAGSEGDGLSPIEAQLDAPIDVSWDDEENLYILNQNNAIRKIEDGEFEREIISSYAGYGNIDLTRGFFGDEFDLGDFYFSDMNSFTFASDQSFYLLSSDMRRENDIYKINPNDENLIILLDTDRSFLDFNPEKPCVISGLGSALKNFILDQDNNPIFINSRFEDFVSICRINLESNQMEVFIDNSFFREGINPLDEIHGMAFDNNNFLYVGHYNAVNVRRNEECQEILKVDLDNRSHSIYAGQRENCNETQDAILATESSVQGISSIVADANNNLYFTNTRPDTEEVSIKKIDAETQIISTFAGPVDPEGVGLFLHARLQSPQDLIPSPIPNTDGFLITGGNHTIEVPQENPDEISQVTVSGTNIYHANFRTRQLKVIAGYPNGFEDGTYPENVRPDDWDQTEVPARFSRFLSQAHSLAYDEVNRKLYLSEKSAHTIRVIDLKELQNPENWTIKTLTGSNDGETGNTDGNLARSRFNSPTGLAFDSNQNLLFVADQGNSKIRMINLNANQVSTLENLENANESHFSFIRPESLLLDDENNRLWVTDQFLRKVYWIDLSSRESIINNDNPLIVREAAGSGLTRINIQIHDGLLAGNIPLPNIGDIALAPNGDLFISSFNRIIRVASVDGIPDPKDPIQVIYQVDQDNPIPADEPEISADTPQLIKGLYWNTEEEALYALEYIQGQLLRFTFERTR